MSNVKEEEMYYSVKGSFYLPSDKKDEEEFPIATSSNIENGEQELKILKDACKNILIRLTIPKKDREEIKQILKLFEFSEEETLIIIGEKKK